MLGYTIYHVSAHIYPTGGTMGRRSSGDYQALSVSGSAKYDSDLSDDDDPLIAPIQVA